MSEVYEKAMQAIEQVEQAEAEAAIEGAVTFTMPASVAFQLFASLHVAIKGAEEDMAGDFKRRTLPSQFTRTTLAQMRAGAEIMEKAIRERVSAERATPPQSEESR